MRLCNSVGLGPSSQILLKLLPFRDEWRSIGLGFRGPFRGLLALLGFLSVRLSLYLIRCVYHAAELIFRYFSDVLLWRIWEFAVILQVIGGRRVI